MRPAYWELNRRGGRRNQTGPRSRVVLGRKHCAGCGHWRHVCDFAQHRGRPRARCRVCQAAYQRQWHANATPEQRERQREYFRFWMEAKRRQQGIQPRNFRHRRSVVDKVEFVGLPTGPLVSAIERVGLADIELGAVAGVPPRSVFRLRQGQELVRLDLADRLAQGLGIPLAIIYGDQPAISIRTREPV